MNLSTLYSGGSADYIEYGWVGAPNATGQSITRDAITVVEINTEVADTGNLVSAPANNRFTLPAGSYIIEARTQINRTDANAAWAYIALRTSAGAFLARGLNSPKAANTNALVELHGGFTLASSTACELVILTAGSANPEITSRFDSTYYDDTTAGAAQRVSIRLWKIG